MNEDLEINKTTVEETPDHGVQINIEDPEKTAWEMKKTGQAEMGVKIPVDNSKYQIITPDKLGDLKYIFQDILAGDKSAALRPEFKQLGFDKVKKTLEWLANNNDLSTDMKTLLMTQGWRLNFRDKPPTPEEFLTPKYIGDQANTLHPWIKETFLKFFNPLSSYRNLILSSCIGTGKSTLTVLANMYIALQFAFMWAPYRYYGYAPSTQFTIVFGGFSQKKAYELLMGPLLNVLRQADFWQQCRTMDDMIKANKEFNNASGIPCIYWTTAAPTSCISISNNLNFNIVSSNGDIIGQNIIMGSATELGFWREQGGWTDEQIYEFFTKLRDRIDSRMKGNRISGFILDSSPNTMESVIDKWIWSEDTRKDPKNLLFTGARWKFFKQDFQGCYDEYGNVKKDFNICFPMFKGGNGLLPRPVENEIDLTRFDPIDIVWCPREGGGISMYDKAKSTPIEFMKDWCGIPSGTADRIFNNPETIEACFNNNLRNIIGEITAPAEAEPEHLIWDQIKDTFFNKVLDKYYFYYEPGIPRTLSVDQSFSGDVTGISMVHVERDPSKIDPETGEAYKVFVVDFTIVIIPNGGIINLDAIKCFIWDLMSLGNIKLKHVSFDTFQSEASMQFLKRKGVLVEPISVDRENEPYYNFIDYVQHGRFHCGKNIYVKNNMKSIQVVKRKGSGKPKIDHMNGEIVTQGDGNWATDMRGVNAKDALDSITAAIWLLNKYSNEYIPYVVWNPETNKSRDYDTLKQKTNDFLSKTGFAVI